MIEAIWYGIIAVFAFMGFLSLIFYLLLYFFKPKADERNLIYIPDYYNDDDIANLIYGAYLRNIIYGGLITKDIFIVGPNIDESKKALLISLSENYSCINFIESKEINSLLIQEEENGTGFC